MTKSKITITGTKKQGFILTIEDKTSCQDIAITFEEFERIVELSKKIINGYKA